MAEEHVAQLELRAVTMEQGVQVISVLSSTVELVVLPAHVEEQVLLLVPFTK